MEREEAIRRIQSWNLDTDDIEVLSVVIPELKESEDFRIRRELLSFLNDRSEDYFIPTNWLSWLKKQGKTSPILSNSSNIGKVEQKPSEWSEEDEKLVKNLISTLSNLYARNLIEKETKEKYTNLLKSLKNRVQPKQEWSEEDRKIIIELIGIFESAIDGGHVDIPYRLIKDYIRVLKSCLPQSTWKPSDEQIEALVSAIDVMIDNRGAGDKNTILLSGLYHELKAL